MYVMWFTALTAVCHIPGIHDQQGFLHPAPAVDTYGALTANLVLVTPRRAAVYPLSCLSFSSTTPWLILYSGGLCPNSPSGCEAFEPILVNLRRHTCSEFFL